MLPSINSMKLVTKLEIMEALDHLYLQRKYQEMTLWKDNCESSNPFKYEGFSVMINNIPLDCQKNSFNFGIAQSDISSKTSSRSSINNDLLCKEISSPNCIPALEKKRIGIDHSKMTSLNSNQNQRDQEIAVQRKTECKINKRKPSVNSNKKKHVSVETKEVRKSCKLNSNLTGEKVMSTNENWGDPKVDGLKPQIMFDTLKSSYIVAPNIEKEVICMYRESESQYWVMNMSDLTKYQNIQRIVSENCYTFKTFIPKVGDFGLIQYENEWYRGKITALTPKPVVFFVDFGNFKEYDEIICKRIPNSIKAIEDLAYPILFDDDAPSECKTENLDAQILVIKGTRKVVNGISVVKVIKIVKETNKIENNMEVNSQEKPCFVKSQKHESSAPPIKNLFRRKFVFDEITTLSSGSICLLPGQGNIRFGAILLPEYDDGHVYIDKSLDCPVSTVIAKEGDIVRVHDSENSDHYGLVLNKIDDKYCVKLKNSEVVTWVHKVYPLSVETQEILNFGVSIVIKEVFFENVLLDSKHLFFEITGSKEPKKWSCHLKSARNGKLIANATLEKPTGSANENILSTFLKSNCTVKLSAFNQSNTFYVQKLSEATERNMSDTNNKIAKFASTAPSLISPPAIGELCCAKCERRQRFYRGRVISHEVEKIRIFFVDFGFTEVVALKDLKRLPDYLQAVPFFSVKINLAKVTPELFTKKVSEYLEKLLKAEVELILTYDRYFENVFLQEKGTGICVNDFIENSKTEMQVNISDKNDALQSYDLKYMKFSIGSVYKLAVLHIKDVEFEEFCSFWATDFSDPNFLYVNTELSSQIAKYCAETSTPHSPEPQELCLAKYEDYWYRALTLEAEGDDFLIFFLDFGNISRLKSQSIREIKQEFAQAPVLAMNFTIKDADRLHKKPDLKKKVFAVLEEKVNLCLNEVEICKYESDSYAVRIPEIEAILEE